MPDLSKLMLHCRRGFELLLRKLLSFRQQPAVLVLHSWSPFFNHPSFYSTVEDLYQSLVSYYGLQSVSVRNAMYHPTWQRQASYQGTQWLCDSIHPNRLGHRSAPCVTSALPLLRQLLRGWCREGASQLSV